MQKLLVESSILSIILTFRVSTSIVVLVKLSLAFSKLLLLFKQLIHLVTSKEQVNSCLSSRYSSIILLLQVLSSRNSINLLLSIIVNSSRVVILLGLIVVSTNLALILLG